MAYRFRRKETIGVGTRRIAREVIDETVRCLGDTSVTPEERTHEARKSIKKLRGLLRLVRPHIESPEVFKAVDRTLRDTAKVLAEARDGDIVEMTLAEIAADAGKAAEAKNGAAPPYPPEDNAVTEHQRAFAKVMESFATLRNDISGWRFGSNGPPDLGAGYIDTYRESRRRMAKALVKRSDAQLHRWRKLVKYHSYHTRLLANFGEEGLADRREESHALEAILGKHHDLTVLESHLDSAGQKKVGGVGVNKLKRRLRRARQSIEQDAARRGKRLFSRKPREVRKELSL